MNRRAIIAAGWAVALAAQCASAQVALPASWSGPWKWGYPPVGWTFAGLGEDLLPDYDGLNDGAAKLDDTGDLISINYDSAPGALSYWIKGLTFISGGVFRVEQSIDGTNWMALATYTNPPVTATFQTHFPSLDARHIRFLYAERITGNVGIDGISIPKFMPPETTSFSLTGQVATVAVLASIVGRTYWLEYADALTNVWSQVGAPMIGSTNPMVFTSLAPTNARMRFYRVRDVTP